MKAVNLVPSESRRGGGGRSGGAVYAILGTLAAMVLMLGITAIEGRSIKDKQAQAAALNEQADAAGARASALAAYANFAALKKARIDTVASLARSRFDWSETMHDIAGTIPSNVWLTRLVGTISPAVSMDGGGSGTGTLRASIQAPAIEILGCTTTHQSVARMMSQMRALPGVQRVTLSASEKADSGGGGGGQGGGSDDCRNGSDRFPQFAMVIFFQPLAQAQSAATQTGAAPAAATTGGGQ